ncbi:hypothetical protein GLOIN_2v1835208 [Rhizophagus clarus]|nr:hypothetical protein GLOIN_2v1835208 [Rhizophagus clarus]
MDKIIDSKIINLNIISVISGWIDKEEISYSSKFVQLRELYLPYNFKLLLLLRGSRDRFTPNKFHELCDDKPNTITLIKVKGEEKIIGGYKTLKWESSGDWVATKIVLFIF